MTRIALLLTGPAFSRENIDAVRISRGLHNRACSFALNELVQMG